MPGRTLSETVRAAMVPDGSRALTGRFRWNRRQYWAALISVDDETHKLTISKDLENHTAEHVPVREWKGSFDSRIARMEEVTEAEWLTALGVLEAEWLLREVR